MNCGGCRNGRKNSANGIWCLLFGIMVNRNHEGCKYHEEGAHGQVREPEDGTGRDAVRLEA